MVKLQILDGPLAGPAREVRSGEDAFTFLTIFFKIGWHWKLDLLSATFEEKKSWLEADMAVRVIRALCERRPVHFKSHVFLCDGSETEVIMVGMHAQDMIEADGQMYAVVADNSQGVVISAVK